MRSLAFELHETNKHEEFGLKEDWFSVQEILEQIIPVYDKTNRYISLGTDLRLRKRGIELLRAAVAKERFSVLDVGCGTGKMSRVLLEGNRTPTEPVLLLDPLRKMLEVARLTTGRQEGLMAVYENLPFREGAFDSAMAGFSIRDARNLSKAFNEVSNALGPEGKFLIVDLSKPDSRLKSTLIAMYWRVFAPVLAFVASGRLGLKFGALATTYKRLPKKTELQSIIKKSGFQISKAEYNMIGGASVLLLTKEAKLNS